MSCPHAAVDDCGSSEGAGVVCDTRPEEEIAAERAMTAVCFEEGVSYNRGRYLDYDVVYSALECQRHCQNHDDCSHFTYYPASNKCYRKTSGEKSGYSAGATSGPRNCSDPDGRSSYTPEVRNLIVL